MEKLKTYRMLLIVFSFVDVIALLAMAIAVKTGVIGEYALSVVLVTVVALAMVLKANMLSNYPFHWIDNPRTLNLAMIIAAVVVSVIITLIMNQPLFKLYNNVVLIFGLIIADLVIDIKDIIRTYRSDYSEYNLEEWTKK